MPPLALKCDSLFVTAPAGRCLRRYVDVFDLTFGCWDWKTIFPQPFDVKHDGFPDLGFDFSNSRARGDTAREVWDVGRVVAFGLFNDDGVAHRASRLQASLLENAVEGTWRKIIAWLARNGDATRLDRVLELSMTSTSCNVIPAVGLEHAQNFTDLHRYRIAAGTSRSPLTTMRGWGQRRSAFEVCSELVPVNTL